MGGSSINKTKTIEKLLTIRCSQCGACCSDPMIEVTQHDLGRLVKHLGKPASELVKLYAPSDFEDTDHDDWVNLSYGRRKLGLRRKRDGTCMFLSSERHCTAYKARPMSCRVFPIDIILDDDNNTDDLELSDVVTDKFIRCKHHYGSPVAFRDMRRKAVQSRNETVSYWKKVSRWNRTRGRGRKRDFLEFLGFESR